MSHLRDRLIEAIKKVPDSVNSGTYQQAVNYKAFYKKAEKYIKSGKDNDQEISSLLNTYWGYK